jgi:hypothetical protein
MVRQRREEVERHIYENMVQSQSEQTVDLNQKTEDGGMPSEAPEQGRVGEPNGTSTQCDKEAEQ